MEIPQCPVAEHAGSKVVRDGWYGKPPHRRQRWRCTSSSGEKHRFTPVLTRQGDPHTYCVECSTALEPWEGQAGAREYRFAAREVGEALVAVARGSSYQVAAEAARRHAGRLPATEKPQAQEWRRRDPARDGQVVANWVDVFSGLVCAGELPDQWPEVLLIDSMNFRIRTGDRSGRGFHVFAAVGWEPAEAGKRAPTPVLWRLSAFPHKDQPSWQEFFGGLPGAPCVVVSDADRAITAAVETAFAASPPELRMCEWHLGRKLRDHLPDQILADRTHPITRALATALHTPQTWATLDRAIRDEHACGEHRPLTLAIKWLETYGPKIESQTATREPDRPNSTGPVEKVLREINHRLGDRIGSFTNQTRMVKLLALMTLDIRGTADAREWADRLRERLYLTGGRPTNQRPHDDPKGTYSLIS